MQPRNRLGSPAGMWMVPSTGNSLVRILTQCFLALSQRTGSLDVVSRFRILITAIARHPNSTKPPALKGETPKSFFESSNGWIRKSISRDADKHYHSFPLQTVYSDAGTSLWLCVTIFPRSATRSSIRYDVYTSHPKGAASVKKSVLEIMEREARSSVRRLEAEFALLKTGNEIEGTADTGKSSLG